MEQHHQAAVAAAAAAWDQVRLHHGGPYPPIPMQQGYALFFSNLSTFVTVSIQKYEKNMLNILVRPDLRCNFS